MSVEVIRAAALDGIAHGFLGRKGGVSEGVCAGLNVGWGADDDRAAIAEGYDATAIPSYGPESRGGTSYADVHIAEREVLNPAAPEPHALVAFNAPSLAKFAPAVVEGGLILYDCTVIADPGSLPEGRRVLAVPFTGLAAGLGRPMVKNVVALGALQAALGLLPDDRMVDTLRHVLHDKPSLISLNEAAFAAGRAAVADTVPA